MSKIEKKIMWIVGEFLKNASKRIVIHVVYDKTKGEAKIYLEGKKIATISEEVSIFNFPLNDEQIAKLHKICQEV